MKSLIYILTVVLSITVFAEPHFVVPEMLYRNGLTDAQYEYLWKLGRNPTIEPAAARQWVFLSARGANITNWLNIVGKTNNYAALSYELAVTNQVQLDVIQTLVGTNSALQASLQTLATKYTSLSNVNAIIEGQLDAAQNKITAEIESLTEEKADLEEKIADSKYILLRPWLKVKLAAVETRIKNLEALTML